MNSLIKRNDADLAIVFTDDAEERKHCAIECSSLIGIVRNPQDQDAAVVAHKMIRDLLKDTEDSRVSAKAPVLDYGRTIDRSVKEWVEDLEAENIRLAKVIGNYQQEQLAIARAAQAKRDEELRKIEEERIAETNKAAKALGVEDRGMITPELAKEIERQNELAKQKIESLKPVPLPPKAAGQSIAQPWRWELVNIQLLYKMHPGLVNPMTPNVREIGETIKMLAGNGKPPEIHGLRIWQETISGTRSTTRKAIDV